MTILFIFHYQTTDDLITAMQMTSNSISQRANLHVDHTMRASLSIMHASIGKLLNGDISSDKSLLNGNYDDIFNYDV